MRMFLLLGLALFVNSAFADTPSASEMSSCERQEFALQKKSKRSSDAWNEAYCKCKAKSKFFGSVVDDYVSCMKERETAGYQREQERLAAMRAEAEQRRAQQKAAQEEEARKQRERAAKENEEREVRLAAQRAESERRDAEVLATEEAKKKACGKDYRKVRVGMTLSRVEQCFAKFRLMSQINRADGVMSIYEYGGGYVHVIDGRVVAWIAPPRY